MSEIDVASQGSYTRVTRSEATPLRHFRKWPRQAGLRKKQAADELNRLTDFEHSGVRLVAKNPNHSFPHLTGAGLFATIPRPPDGILLANSTAPGPRNLGVKN